MRHAHDSGFLVAQLKGKNFYRIYHSVVEEPCRPARGALDRELCILAAFRSYSRSPILQNCHRRG
jgi:hypothetical protein